MKTDNYSLSQNELIIMNILWENAKPMTSIDLSEYVFSWKTNGYLHNMLKSLELKGYIKKVDSVRIGHRSVNLYDPTLTKDQYAANVLSPLNLQQKSISKLALALTKQLSSNDEEIIDQLEEIIAKLRETKGDT